MDTFSHTVTERSDHVLLTLSGDVDFAAHSRLSAQIITLIDGGQAVVVDCSAVTFLDSMGLRALVEGVHAAGAAGLVFELAEPSPPVLRVLELSGTTGLFKFRDPFPEDREL